MNLSHNRRQEECDASFAPFWAQLMLVLYATLGLCVAHAQTFSSGSTGADGALDFSGCTEVIEWDAAGLDLEHDSVFNFTTVNIPSGCTVRLTARKLGQKPIVFLATGDIQIDGTLDLSGAAAQSNALASIPAVPGPGGFAGGTVRDSGGGNVEATNGMGPGGGGGGGSIGGAAGHVTEGSTGAYNGGSGGARYGTPFLLPLLGGSGGGGSAAYRVGGGAGGGAILLASSTAIRVNGSVVADGGPAGLWGYTSNGGGSGGAIRVIAPSFSGSNLYSSISAQGRGGASGGRIRIEALQNSFVGGIYAGVAGEVRATTLAPNTIILGPAVVIPTLRIVSVDGVPVPPNPTGGFTPADVTINTAAPVTIVIEGKDVPVGTVATVAVYNETTGVQTLDSTPLTGTSELSTATATGMIDPGFSLVTVRANFAP